MTKHFLVLSLFALAAGCQGVNPPIEGRSDPYPSPQVTFATGDLRSRTAVGAPIVQRDDAGNYLHVTLPIRSTSANVVHVDYKITFYDKVGAPIEETGWLNKTLEGNTPDSITANSTTARAADFRLALRSAK